MLNTYLEATIGDRAPSPFSENKNKHLPSALGNLSTPISVSPIIKVINHFTYHIYEVKLNDFNKKFYTHYNPIQKNACSEITNYIRKVFGYNHPLTLGDLHPHEPLFNFS